MKITHKITLSDYIKTIRKHSKNVRKSYQDILSILFGIICSIDESYHVHSASSSRIINREYDLLMFEINIITSPKTIKEMIQIFL